MKKIIPTIATVVMALSLTACGSGRKPVVTTPTGPTEPAFVIPGNVQTPEDNTPIVTEPVPTTPAETKPKEEKPSDGKDVKYEPVYKTDEAGYEWITAKVLPDFQPTSQFEVMYDKSQRTVATSGFGVPEVLVKTILDLDLDGNYPERDLSYKTTNCLPLDLEERCADLEATVILFDPQLGSIKVVITQENAKYRDSNKFFITTEDTTPESYAYAAKIAKAITGEVGEFAVKGKDLDGKAGDEDIIGNDMYEEFALKYSLTCFLSREHIGDTVNIAIEMDNLGYQKTQIIDAIYHPEGTSMVPRKAMSDFTFPLEATSKTLTNNFASVNRGVKNADTTRVKILEYIKDRVYAYGTEYWLESAYVEFETVLEDGGLVTLTMEAKQKLSGDKVKFEQDTTFTSFDTLIKKEDFISSFASVMRNIAPELKFKVIKANPKLERETQLIFVGYKNEIEVNRNIPISGSDGNFTIHFDPHTYYANK